MRVCARVRWVFVGVSGFVTFSWPHFLFLATLRGHPRGARQHCGALTLRAMLLNHFINIHTHTHATRTRRATHNMHIEGHIIYIPVHVYVDTEGGVRARVLLLRAVLLL